MGELAEMALWVKSCLNSRFAVLKRTTSHSNGRDHVFEVKCSVHSISVAP